MATAPITISSVSCLLPSRTRITWTTTNDDESVSVPPPSAAFARINGTWQECEPMWGGCPVPLPPNTGCADSGVDFLAHITAVQAYGITHVKLEFSSYDDIVFELASPCGG